MGLKVNEKLWHKYEREAYYDTFHVQVPYDDVGHHGGRDVELYDAVVMCSVYEGGLVGPALRLVHLVERLLHQAVERTVHTRVLFSLQYCVNFCCLQPYE